MTQSAASREPDWFAKVPLPWLVAGAALALYAVTLSHGLSPLNSESVSRVAGWDWRPLTREPLLLLVELPLWLLPGNAQTLAINLLSALLAAAALGLLARSVALLPRDRFVDPRRVAPGEPRPVGIPHSWLPPVLACLVAGLQLTFWEHAVSGLREMLNLALFAYGIRCLLEFRVEGQDRWLYRATLVYAVSIPNNWAMIAFLPVFLAALIWLKGLRFFSTRFLSRVLLLGAAGLLIYLALPLLHLFAGDPMVTFWEALKANVTSQFDALRVPLRRFYDAGRAVALLLALVSLIPVFMLCLRWRSVSWITSQVDSIFTNLPFHIAHGVLLAVCLWAALDPPFSPRIAGPRAGVPLPYLTLYYLSFLSIGYYSGYFLVMFHRDVLPPEMPPWSLQRRAFGLVRSGVWLALGVFPALLLWKNLPIVTAQRDWPFRAQAEVAARALPPDGCIVLSDEPSQLLVLRAVLRRENRLDRYVLLDTAYLFLPPYRVWLHRQHPQLWPSEPAGIERRVPAGPAAIVALLRRLSETHTIYYLQPSFGYYFEHFYLEPRGPVYEFKPFPGATLEVPGLSAEVIALNQDFWTNQFAPHFGRLTNAAALAESPERTLRYRVLRAVRARFEPDLASLYTAAFYSRALITWGVTLQRQGLLPEAADAFQRARQLSAQNLAAEVNLATNDRLARGEPLALRPDRPTEELFGRRFRSWDELLNQAGRVDHPDYCYQFAVDCMRPGGDGLFRQAYLELRRALELVPGSAAAHFQLCVALSYLGDSQRVVKELEAVRQRATAGGDLGLGPMGELDLDFLEIRSLFRSGSPEQADRRLQDALSRYVGPEVPRLLAVSTRPGAPAETATLTTTNLGPLGYWALRLGADMYLSRRETNSHAKALSLLALILHDSPNDLRVLAAKGEAHLEVGQPAEAIRLFDRALTLRTNDARFLLKRGFAHLRAEQPDAAEADFLKLEKVQRHAPLVQFGLGEVSFQRKDTNAAVRRFEAALKDLLPASTEAQQVEARLQALRAPPP